ncbi:hypothetical protein E1A91_D06G133100v1 [Gossypium mustelinum]|uniref:Uncharacterized protein n=5 Tax=Gossypium TaxID=3633 RepID=A0A0D2V893_GOSRA|nr:uncharacterized protein LOC105774365 [Gossypium raimondii]KAB2025141.1 hypothetical protein ES319_D06G131600v1 [Gossypium barbadense]MBA0777938.1 hypothetical protein [Gossypium trilobum]TYG64861.1 hypothetical protein ES288_D06G140800v1 [Gossypium darwinii]TYI77273.1 hypothetical protein E1A91_D06G133100v1 [Gossypium mustelinum]KJB65500.1 hypothetical protein B456_010G130400 [Gossypium raimondii]
MAKSMRSKREKRLRAIRREIVEPFYQKKDEAKMAAIEAALAAPKLPASSPPSGSMQLEEQVTAPSSATTNLNSMEVEMADSDENKTKASLRAIGRIGKMSKKKLKIAKKKRRAGGKGKIRGKRNL